MTTNTDYISSWKSKGLCSESIKPPTTSDNSLTSALIYYGSKTRVKFTGSCLKRSKISYNHGKVVNIYIVAERFIRTLKNSHKSTFNNSLNPELSY